MAARSLVLYQTPSLILEVKSSDRVKITVFLRKFWVIFLSTFHENNYLIQKYVTLSLVLDLYAVRHCSAGRYCSYDMCGRCAGIFRIERHIKDMFKGDFAMRCSNSQKIKLEIYVMSFPIGQNLRFKWRPFLLVRTWDLSEVLSYWSELLSFYSRPFCAWDLLNLGTQVYRIGKASGIYR